MFCKSASLGLLSMSENAEKSMSINPMYTGGFFHCYMLDESFRHFKGVGSVLSLLFFFLLENPASKQWIPDQKPHYVVSDQCVCTVCL